MDDLILANARVIDGLGGVMERATVRVAGNRIAEVEAGADVEPKPVGEVIDLSGRTLMPALIDAHIRFSSFGSEEAGDPVVADFSSIHSRKAGCGGVGE